MFFNVFSKVGPPKALRDVVTRGRRWQVAFDGTFHVKVNGFLRNFYTFMAQLGVKNT